MNASDISQILFVFCISVRCVRCVTIRHVTSRMCRRDNFSSSLFVAATFDLGYCFSVSFSRIVDTGQCHTQLITCNKSNVAPFQMNHNLRRNRCFFLYCEFEKRYTCCILIQIMQIFLWLIKKYLPTQIWIELEKQMRHLCNRWQWPRAEQRYSVRISDISKRFHK